MWSDPLEQTNQIALFGIRNSKILQSDERRLPPRFRDPTQASALEFFALEFEVAL